MAINIKNLEELIQKKAYAVTSSTPTSDLGDIVEASLLATNSLREYDSAGLLPAATSNEKIAFVKSDKSVRFNNGSKWDTLTSGAAQAGSSGAATPSSARQGTNNGFVMGGTPPVSNVIEKYPFASDGNGADVGDLTESKYQLTAASSGDNIYTQGGYTGSAAVDKIEKISTSTDGNATDVANLLAPYRTGGGTQSATHGYAVGNNAATNIIQKHQFSNDGDATDVGDLLTTQNRSTGTSASDDYGYLAGGYNPTQPDGDFADTIQKWPFAADANATDVGDLSVNSYKAYNTGTSGDTHGYSHGGQGGLPISFAHSLTIEKYSFSADGNSTDVGDLTIASTEGAGSSSTTHGYGHGGSPPLTNTIQKYSFSSDGDATDVGDMLSSKKSLSGSQH